VDARTLTEDVTWVYDSHPVDDGRQIHSSLHLIESDEGTLLINSGDHDLRDEFKARILEVTDGAGVDAIFAQESHIPNSANVSAFRREWDADIIFPGGASPIHGFPEVEQWPQYGTETLYGRTFDLTRGPLLDLPHTTWIFDRQSGVLFSLDGFCYYHRSGEEGLFSNELPDGIRYEDVKDYYSEMLLWLKYADPDKLLANLAEVIDEYDIEFVAPAHGNPISADDLDQYMAHIRQAVTEIAESYEYKMTTP
jgi:flavorubredoxin